MTRTTRFQLRGAGRGMRKVVHKNLNRSFGGNMAIGFFLLLMGTVMALPMVYAISNAFKPMEEFFVFPPRFFVRNPTLANFGDLSRLLANTRVPFSRYVVNTLFISVVGTVGNVICSSLCAFAISKLRWRGKNVIFQIIVLSLMFSASVTSIPNYIIMKQLGFIDTYMALIVPAFATPLGLYLMKQFIDQMVPDSVLEAAKIDGAGVLRTFFVMVMPMVKPAWLTLVIFSFQGLWNTGTTSVIFREDLKTINYAMSQILAGGIARSGAAAAATVLIMIVPILLFVVTQSNIVETLSTSGMKD